MSEVVNIILKYDKMHARSMGALLESIKSNKNPESIYRVYILGDEQDKITLADAKTQNVFIEWITNDKAETINPGKVIYIAWNALVLGDLSDLYANSLDGYDYGAVRNIPECISFFKKNQEDYSHTVILIEYLNLLKKWDRNEIIQGDSVKSLPIYYNMGLQELCDEQRSIDIEKFEKITGLSNINISYLAQRAVIVRLDPKKSVEKYFDVILAGQWLGYYQKSDFYTYDEPLQRMSFVQTSGKVCIDNNKENIPVFLTLESRDVAYGVVLLYSLKTCLEKNKKLDVRICYRQLTEKQKKMLLAVADERVSIILLNYKNVQKEYMDYPQFLAAFIFDGYRKVIYLNPVQICCESVSELYHYDVKEYYILATEKQVWTKLDLDDNGICEEAVANRKKYFDGSVMIMNVQKIRQECIDGKLLESFCLQHQKNRSFEQCFNKLFEDQIGVLPEYWHVQWSHQKKLGEQNPDVEELVYQNIRYREKYAFIFLDGIENPWKDLGADDWVKNLLYKYAGMSQYEEQIIEEGIHNWYEKEGIMNIIKMENLEKQNQDLKDQIDKLEQELNQTKQYSTQYLYELTETRKSFTYKIGRLITWLPRMIRSH